MGNGGALPRFRLRQAFGATSSEVDAVGSALWLAP